MAQNTYLSFTENKGQWNNNVQYRAKLPAGDLFLESNKLTYQFYRETDLERIDDLHHGTLVNPSKEDSIINLHAFNVTFVNSLVPKLTATKPLSTYENYYLGNDKNKWASNVKKYQEVEYRELYKGINLKFYQSNNTLKYDFIIAPNKDVTQIKLKYKGAESTTIKDGHLYIKTSVNTLIENKPFAYQKINGTKKEVPCNYVLKNNTLSFEFPKGYDKNFTLIIDPALIFASYSGAEVGNWGFTSTYDETGHLYGAGVVFGVGYPVTTGALQLFFNGGSRDASISKFSPDGTTLIYSTYLGGIGEDNPHSLIVDNNDNLVVFGTTASPNFPVYSTAYDDTLNGTYDIFVSKISSDGTALLGSSFIGGSGIDGLNKGNPLKYNYADDYRGEVVVDENNNIFVASTTLSTDFPTTAGVIKPNFISGDNGQNACVFKLNPSLDSLIWSTYFGGNMDDAAYSLQFDKIGNILFTGGTKSWDLPTSASAINPILGGIMDGYIVKMTSDATSLIACTYIGTEELDQTYFVQLDTADNIYVVGQTEGVYPITPATVYNDSNSGQFIHKLTPDLSSTVFSTTFGTSSGEVDISLSAFLVNNCNYILISGWGGSLNATYALADYSTTNGLPITPNAVQNTTDGNDYYLAMFSEDANQLLMGTFFGGSDSREHVDGGTSRFDKKGIVYQAVCAGCFGNNDFPTTPGAYSNINGTSLPGISSQCNLGVFKINLTKLTVDAEVYTTPYYCVGDTVHFQNLSIGGYNYYWEFDDGNSSTEFEPFHVFDSAGTYHVMLTSIDSIACILTDSDYVDIYISPPPTASITPVVGVCKGDSIELNATGGEFYYWLSSYHISDSLIENPIVWPDTSTTYTVVVGDSCGIDTASIFIEILNPSGSIIPDTSICRGDSIEIEAFYGKYYLWSPDSTLSLNDISNPIASPYYTTNYNVSITDLNNCVKDTFMTLYVDTLLPQAVASNDTSLCFGQEVELYVDGGQNYNWSPSSSLNNPSFSNPIASPTNTTLYTVSSSNGCGIAYDSVLVSVHQVIASIVSDSAVCIGETVSLWASGGDSYFWEPSFLFSNPTYASVNTNLFLPTLFSVEVFKNINSSLICSLSLSVFMDTLPLPYVELGNDINTSWGNIVTLYPETNANNYIWSPSQGLSCINCLNPEVDTEEVSTYSLTVTSDEGCINTDTITISFDGVIYVPNAFTPDGDGVNDVFYVYGKDIVEFELLIVDRWGEELFYTKDIDEGWDGYYRGTLSKVETYVWKIKYKDIQGNPGEQIGTVSLIR
ncbi:T9SS type B sorting domain-containing protein [Vicingus serpentipes]|uniref:T9SS type B sorting domain-containing protein n=1 Tax=Vicingus serpentipes TaxID=1926625 RepID=A0A5C6RQN6_9FLAO|nr:gliding motility-associated C-terminal domain-containing protein [Vicingus serpentipes]TXB64716.1 T9SS type B sorting domain-containing protein [Vicingus serpentipes]